MLKWILLITGIYILVGVYSGVTSSYTPISKQIDVKSMSLTKPNYITTTRTSCTGICQNYSSSSSYGGGSYGGK